MFRLKVWNIVSLIKYLLEHMFQNQIMPRSGCLQPVRTTCLSNPFPGMTMCTHLCTQTHRHTRASCACACVINLVNSCRVHSLKAEQLTNVVMRLAREWAEQGGHLWSKDPTDLTSYPSRQNCCFGANWVLVIGFLTTGDRFWSTLLSTLVSFTESRCIVSSARYSLNPSVQLS